MKTALYFLIGMGTLGAFDTIYYHEWRLRLAAASYAGRELFLHAARDFIYAIVFVTLAWRQWNGALVWVLAALLAAEIVITLADFLQEDRTRKLPAGERVMHALMGINYGIFLALLFPQAAAWSRQPTGFAAAGYDWMSWVLTLYAAGVFASGVRDLAASRKTG